LQTASGRRRLVEGLKAIDSRPARACLFLCYTGFRRGEATAVTAANLIAPRVLEFQSKTRTLRVPLSDQALALIDRQSPETLLNVCASALREPLRKLFGMRKTPRGIKSCVTPHDLRRYFKSVATELGIDPTVKNILVGHSIQGVDKSYIAKLRLAVLLAATQAIANEVENPNELPGEDALLLEALPPVIAATESSKGIAPTPTETKGFFKRTSRYLQTADEPERFVQYLVRKELHTIVWTAPMVEVAARFGVSDVGLAKICRRACIPTPPRGYWAKLDSGFHITPRPLPRPPRGLPDLIRIRGANRVPDPLAVAT